MEIKELKLKLETLENKFNELQKQINTISLYNAGVSRLIMEQQPEALTKTIETIIKEIKEANSNNEKEK